MNTDEPEGLNSRGGGVRLRPMRTLIHLLALLLLAVTGGCTITTEGIQNFEVPLEETLPPSRVVASYRRLAAPTGIKGSELESEFGGKEQIEVIEKWSKMKALFAEYGIPERPPKARITVMEMSSKQNAYGAYSNLRPSDLPEKSYVKIGVHATVNEDRLLFVQDRFLILVRDLSGSKDPERRTMLINFGHATSERIPRDITDISLVGYLPYENRVPATERLDKDDPLGMGVLKGGGVTALFRNGNRECHVFLAEMKEKGGAKGAFKDVKKAIEKEGGASESLTIGEEGLTGKFHGALCMAARRESVVFGCYGTFDEKEMKSLMANIDRRIKPYVPPKVKEENKDAATEAEEKKKKGK